ncbi:hypothetical protein DIJ64_00435 [Mycobacterium leprae]|uniref:Uncharacterized protein n=1 Tax=Mycobacterium leprae TaxID=1769 RepID=A0AAD0KQE0_MYCLR|nr:hypothetical protein [Mycobacterium leprae]AWV47085.1 hypothetical protein DIJ64_00435 [Mycobacterium leprae]OAR21313.1 hypothetical protein A8144_06820 [Mycobacterium leprae 3125609]OAX71398.1 hypothetical protein A3216_05995 [Mycobacterium leprae 7935681]
MAIFNTKQSAYITDYAEQMASVLNAKQANWEIAESDLLLERWRVLFEPIMLQSNVISDRTGYLVELIIVLETVVLDFPKHAQALADF